MQRTDRPNSNDHHRTIPVDLACAYALDVLETAGYPTATAQLLTDQMVAASLRGVDSHGVSVLLSFYAADALHGTVSIGAAPEVETVDGSCSTIDGHGAPGVEVMAIANAVANNLVAEQGIAAISIRNSGYLGDLFYFVNGWAEQGFIALMMANAEAQVAPHNGREPLHGTNPIAFAFPTSDHPIVVDMRTNALRRADYWSARLNSAPLPEGGVLNRLSLPSTNTEDVASGVLLPLAGAKGYGLALAVDLLTAGLAGGKIGQELGFDDGSANSAFLLVIDTNRFGSADRFLSAASRLAEQARAVAPTDPDVPVRLPGDRGFDESRLRSHAGIPVDARWEWMIDDLKALGIDTPLPGFISPE